MENNKTYKILGTTVLCLAIVALIGISYAAFSQQLTINGSATVKKSSWKIQFLDLQGYEHTGTATETVKPSISSGDTTIGDYAVTLTTPGDSISYKVSVKNAGSFNAKLSSVTIPKPQCSGNSEETGEQDAANVCENLEYTLTYVDGGQAVNVNDTLDSGATKQLQLTLKYKDFSDPAKLPKDDVTISNLQVVLNYTQA